MDSKEIITQQQDLEAMAPCRIGFLGGSFNPIHEGHIAIAEYALENFVDYVVFCPHSHHPDKKEILVPIEHRINMMLILKSISRYSQRIFIIHPSFIHGVQYNKFTSLCDQLKEKNIYTAIICGADCFSRPYYPGLCQLDHYIGIRGVYYCEEEIQMQIKGKTVFFNTPYTTLSSTKIRTKLSEKRVDDIHENLRKYILDNNLFQNIYSTI
ncbi:MAG: hypothetical protein EHM93_06995 [Bacteroidales bacterium]|nr:MAG: hypothetical protein EHM93_06995 [Bacteroidales bacterium]